MECRAFDYINFAKMEKIEIEGVSTAKMSKKYTDFPGTNYYINVNTNKNKLTLRKSNLDSNESLSLVTSQTTTYLTLSDDSEYDD